MTQSKTQVCHGKMKKSVPLATHSVCTSQNPLRFTFITTCTLWWRSATMWSLQSALRPFNVIKIQLAHSWSSEAELRLTNQRGAEPRGETAEAPQQQQFIWRMRRENFHLLCARQNCSEEDFLWTTARSLGALLTTASVTQCRGGAQ